MGWYRELLIERGIANSSDIVGVSSKELESLEVEIALSLPAAYRQFLSDCGKRAGRLGRDIELFYPQMRHMRTEAEELLDEGTLEYQLPSDAFVFSGYQGYIYHFFRCASSDPPVWRLRDDDEPPMQVADSFSDHFRRMVATCPR